MGSGWCWAHSADGGREDSKLGGGSIYGEDPTAWGPTPDSGYPWVNPAHSSVIPGLSISWTPGPLWGTRDTEWVGEHPSQEGPERARQAGARLGQSGRPAG